MIGKRGALIFLLAPAGATAQGVLPPDKPVAVAGVEAVCTGVGSDARDNPLWASYPLKIEVAGQGGQYLGDVRLTLSQGDKTIAAVGCGGPWILFRLRAGRYHVEAQTEGQTASALALVPESGQGRVVLRFPGLGGQIAAPKTAGME